MESVCKKCSFLSRRTAEEKCVNENSFRFKKPPLDEGITCSDFFPYMPYGLDKKGEEFIYRFRLNGVDRIIKSKNYEKIMDFIIGLEGLGTIRKYPISFKNDENADFLRFIKSEVPDVYKKLLQNYRKRLRQK